MIETRKVYVLRHESGLYISVDPDNMPHTRKLSRARKFSTIERLSDFLSNSFYRPDKPSEYEIVDVTITYRIEDPEGIEDGGK